MSLRSSLVIPLSSIKIKTKSPSIVVRIHASEIKQIMDAYQSVKSNKFCSSISKDQKKLQRFYNELQDKEKILSSQKQLKLIHILIEIKNSVHASSTSRKVIDLLLNKLYSFISLIEMLPSADINYLCKWREGKSRKIEAAIKILYRENPNNVKLKSHLSLIYGFPKHAVRLAKALVKMPFCDRELFCQETLNNKGPKQIKLSDISFLDKRPKKLVSLRDDSLRTLEMKSILAKAESIKRTHKASILSRFSMLTPINESKAELKEVDNLESKRMIIR